MWCTMISDKIELKEDKLVTKHDVWTSEIRIKLRGRDKKYINNLIKKLKLKWKEEDVISQGE